MTALSDSKDTIEHLDAEVPKEIQVITGAARGIALNFLHLASAAVELAQRLMPQDKALFANDWWLCKLVSGVGGQVIRDDRPPVVLCRQHAFNAFGSDKDLMAQIARKRAILSSAFSEWMDLNAVALHQALDVIFETESQAQRLKTAIGSTFERHYRHVLGSASHLDPADMIPERPSSRPVVMVCCSG